MSKFWRKVVFWENMQKTCAVFGGPATAGLSYLEAASGWVWAAGMFATLGALLSIWMVDHNKNGIVDIFE